MVSYANSIDGGGGGCVAWGATGANDMTRRLLISHLSAQRHLPSQLYIYSYSSTTVTVQALATSPYIA